MTEQEKMDELAAATEKFIRFCILEARQCPEDAPITRNGTAFHFGPYGDVLDMERPDRYMMMIFLWCVKWDGSFDITWNCFMWHTRVHTEHGTFFGQSEDMLLGLMAALTLAEEKRRRWRDEGPELEKAIDKAIDTVHAQKNFRAGIVTVVDGGKNADIP